MSTKIQVVPPTTYPYSRSISSTPSFSSPPTSLPITHPLTNTTKPTPNLPTPNNSSPTTNSSPRIVQEPETQINDHIIQPSIIQPSIIQPSIIQPFITQPSIIQKSITQPSITQPSIIQKSNVQPSIIQKSNVQPSITQKYNVQPSITQKSSVQLSSMEPSITQKSSAQLSGDNSEYSLSVKLPGVVATSSEMTGCSSIGKIPLITLPSRERVQTERVSVSKPEDMASLITDREIYDDVKEDVVRDLMFDAKNEIESLRTMIKMVIEDAKRGQVSMKMLYDVDINTSKVSHLLSESIKLLS